MLYNTNLPFCNIAEIAEWAASLHGVALFDVLVLTFQALIIHNTPWVGSFVKLENRPVDPLTSKVVEENAEQNFD